MEEDVVEDSIKVVVRMRPVLARESAADIHWKVIDEHTIVNDDEKSYSFDRVYREVECTEDVYNNSAKDVVNSAMAGYNGTIFAYGQTASGKTYTIFGTDTMEGILQMALSTIFSKIAEGSSKRYMLRMSCIEIYNEKVRDLLSDSGTDLPVKDFKQKTVVDGLREEVIVSSDAVVMLIQAAFARRVIGETALNERSSRSHVILRFVIECYDDDDIATDTSSYISFLNIVDLAGSESAKHSGADGDRLKESGKINTGLLALQNVINQLSEKGHGYVNFRDSKLTRLLKSSLGGNARTLIICTASPTETMQTLYTLRFAARAKKIKNKPHKNKMKEGMLKQYIQTIERLKAELEENRKNENVERELINKNIQLSKEVERLRKCILTSQILPSSTQVLIDRRARRQTWGGNRARPCFDATSPFRNSEPLSCQKSDLVVEGPKIGIIDEESSEQADSVADFDASVVAFTTLQLDDDNDSRVVCIGSDKVQHGMSQLDGSEELSLTVIEAAEVVKDEKFSAKNCVSDFDRNCTNVEFSRCTEKREDKTLRKLSPTHTTEEKVIILEAANCELREANDRLTEANEALEEQLKHKDKEIRRLEKSCDSADCAETKLREQLYELAKAHENDLSIIKSLQDKIAKMEEALTVRNAEDRRDSEDLIRLQREMRRKEREVREMKQDIANKNQRISSLLLELRRVTSNQENKAERARFNGCGDDNLSLKEDAGSEVMANHKNRYTVEVPPAELTPLRNNSECRTQ